MLGNNNMVGLIRSYSAYSAVFGATLPVLQCLIENVWENYLRIVLYS